MTSHETPGWTPDQSSPRGTLVVVGIFGALVVVGWLALYFGLFLPRVSP